MFRASLTVKLAVVGLNREQLSALFDLLGSELMERQGDKSSLLDHSVSIDLGLRVIEIAVTTEARTQREAEALANYYIQDVVTATGGNYKSEEPEVRSSKLATPFSADITSRELVSV